MNLPPPSASTLSRRRRRTTAATVSVLRFALLLLTVAALLSAPASSFSVGPSLATTTAAAFGRRRHGGISTVMNVAADRSPGGAAAEAAAINGETSESAAVKEEEDGAAAASDAVKKLAEMASSTSAPAKAAEEDDTSTPQQPPLQVQPHRNRNIFQSGVYDKPVVLLGCSGPGDELRRLAASLSAKLGGGGEGSVVDAASSFPVGLTAGAVRDMDKTSVIVLDFASTVQSDVGEDDAAMKDAPAVPQDAADRMAELARTLYEYEGLLAVYVNVHPVHGRLSDGAGKVREAMEGDVFVAYSDYEICVKNEGLLLDADDDADPTDRPVEENDILEGSAADGWAGTEWELSRLLARASLPPAIPGSVYTPGTLNSADINMGRHTFFLSLSFPHVSETAPYLEAMCQDVDAMEYRADLIAARDDRFELSYQLQTLRRMCRPHAVRAPRLPLAGRGRGGLVITDSVPVVFTVRTAHQAGTYPDDEEGIERMFGLLEVGFRSAVEVCDVESAWSEGQTDALLSKSEERYATQVLGSHHVVGKESSMEEAVGYYRQCQLNGRAHGAKVVLSVDDDSKDAMALDSGLIAQSLCRSAGKPVIPNVSLLLGEAGQYSRILNTRFTPVTHESLPFVAAPGQLTANEIMATRLVMGQLRPKNFGILGHNIAYSVSPAMHSAAFAATKLPHSYTLLDMEDVKDLIESDFWTDDDFGGMSVTIPHKQNIMPYMDVMSDAVESIGAMNTVIVEKDGDGKRRLRGENTDWRGIHGPLERRLGPRPKSSAGGEDGGGERGVALILGGGGTARAAAYAARELGLHRVYWNRTPSKAEELAEAFGGAVVADLEEGGGGAGGGGTGLGDALGRLGAAVPSAVISTLPAAAGFVLPQWLVDRSSSSSTKPIVFDVNYKPYRTPLLVQAETNGYELIRGSEMLWEQGVGQFELWTGRTAPYGVMRGVVLENCLPAGEERE